MDDDPTLDGVVVDAGIEADELQRVAVRAGVGLAGEERAEARAAARRIVAEPHCTLGIAVGRGAAPVGDELVKEHAQPVGVDDPQAALRRRQRVVDDRQEVRPHQTRLLDPMVRGETR